MSFQNLQDALKYFEENSGGRNEFFQLKNDKETATVRFLHEGEQDLDWYIVHEFELAGKKRWVKCLQEGCPACQAGNRAQLKLFLQMIDKRDGKTKTWERGQKFIPKVISFINRYGNLCAQPVDIERMGKPNDTKTDYNLYPLQRDDMTLDQLPKRQKLLGEVGENSFILNRTADDIQRMVNGTYVLDGGVSDNSANSDKPPFEPDQPTVRRERKATDFF